MANIVSLREIMTDDDGMIFRVVERCDGKFAVTLEDADCGEILPTVIVFNDEPAAHRFVIKQFPD